MLALARRLGLTLWQDERGQVAFGFMLLMIVVFMFFALAVDTGIWALDHRTAQNQVDAAALAGALELTDEGLARTEAELTLARNGIDDPDSYGCNDLGGDWFDSEITGSGPGQIARVEVCQRRPSEVIFSALTGVLDVMVSAKGVAAMYEEPLIYSIMAMSQGECPGFDVSGQGQVEVVGGATYTRSACTVPQGALRVSGTGNASIVSTGNEVVGNSNTGGNATPAPTAASQIIDDPFDFLSQPNDWPEFASLPTINGNINVSGAETLTPGIYNGPVSVGNGDTLTLTEGLYVFRRGLSQTDGLITSNGAEVLLYSTCQNVTPCSGAGRAGDLSFTGGTLNLTGDLDHYNILFWIDRTSQLSNPRATLSLTGSGVLDLEGIAYGLTSHCHLSGQGTLDLELNMSFICGTIDFSGQANITVNYDPIHAPVKREIALVE